MAFGDGVIVAWGALRGTSGGDWLGVPPGGGSFVVPFANVAPFKNGLLADESTPSAVAFQAECRETS